MLLSNAGHRCELSFKPAGWFSRDLHRIEGFILDQRLRVLSRHMHAFYFYPLCSRHVIVVHSRLLFFCLRAVKHARLFCTASGPTDWKASIWPLTKISPTCTPIAIQRDFLRLLNLIKAFIILSSSNEQWHSYDSIGNELNQVLTLK